MGCAPSKAQLDEIRALFSAQDAKLTQAEKAFAAAAVNRPAPNGAAACTTTFRTADEAKFAERLASAIALDATSGGLQASNVTFFPRGARLDRVSSGSVEARRAEEEQLLNRQSFYQEMDGKKLVAAARALVKRPLDPELLIEIGASVDAKPIDGKSFQGGLMVGRAWLYSLAENRFVCAGDVAATSSKQVEVWQWKGSPKSDGKVEVSGDLYINLAEEAQKSLHAL